MDVLKRAEAPAGPSLRDRDQIPDRFKWDLTRIFPDWSAWQVAYAELDRQIDAFGALRGTLVNGADALLAALVLRDEIGQLEYKVWYFASLCYDQDQRDNQANAKRQEVQILFAKAAQASAWFDPELLAIHEVLERFAAIEPLKAELVKLKYFAGLATEEAAAILGISPATAKRNWAYARAWLFREMQREKS